MDYLLTSLVSVAASALSQSEIVKSVIGGAIGNRADWLFCKALGKCWNNSKGLWSKEHLPKNADLLRALREAQLTACERMYRALKKTLDYKHEMSERKARKNFESTFEEWLEQERKLLGTELQNYHADPSYEHIEGLLAGAQISSIENFRKRMSCEAKKSIWENMNAATNTQCPKLPKIFRRILVEGWIEGDTTRDWFDILTLEFATILKRPERQAAQLAMQDRILSDTGVKVSVILAFSESIPALQETVIVTLQTIKALYKDVATIERKTGCMEQDVRHANAGIAALHDKLDTLLGRKIATEEDIEVLKAKGEADDAVIKDLEVGRVKLELAIEEMQKDLVVKQTIIDELNARFDDATDPLKRKAQEQLNKGHRSAALQFLRESREKLKQRQNLRRIVEDREEADTLFEEGKIYEYDLHYQDALHCYLAAIKLQPENIDYLLAIGGIAWTLGQLDLASEHLEQAIDFILARNGVNSAKAGTCYSRIGSVYYLKGKYNIALTNYEKSKEYLLKPMEKCTMTWP